jgi:hypothetical protein
MDASNFIALKVNADFIERTEALRRDFDAIMPRRIMPPAGYLAPRFWWTTAFTAVHPDIEIVNGMYPENLRVCVANAMSMMRSLNAPTYFPSRELIDALDRTDVEGIDFKDIRFPADSVMFVLPIDPPYKPYQMEWDGKELTVAPAIVTLSRIGGDLKGSATTLRGREMIEGTMLDSKGDVGWVRLPCEGAWSDTMEKYGSDIVYDRMGVPVDPKGNPVIQRDTEQTQWAFRMAVKLVIAMNTIGDIHAPMPRLVREANPKKGKGELWQGQVMTMTRALESEYAGGTHVSPRFHLRRGHMRSQRHGTGNMLVKTMWIKPTWVGKKDKAAGMLPAEEKA